MKANQKIKAIDKFMHGLHQKIETDNLEDLARKQAELNNAKSILESIFHKQLEKAKDSN